MYLAISPPFDTRADINRIYYDFMRYMAFLSTTDKPQLTIEKDRILAFNSKSMYANGCVCAPEIIFVVGLCLDAYVIVSAAVDSYPCLAWGQDGAHLGPVGPRWTPCGPHKLCYQGLLSMLDLIVLSAAFSQSHLLVRRFCRSVATSCMSTSNYQVSHW